MKLIMKLLIVMFAVALAPMLHAQNACAQGGLYSVSCSSQACNQTVHITVPQSTAYGVLFSPGYVSCCGKNIQSYYQTGGQCLFTTLTDPLVLKKVIEVASTQPILVANCKGQYEPLVERSAIVDRGKDWKAGALSEKIVWSVQ